MTKNIRIISILEALVTKVLNLNDKINQLKIPKNGTIEEIRNSFTPFRSVIILINLKEENIWDKIIKKIGI